MSLFGSTNKPTFSFNNSTSTSKATGTATPFSFGAKPTTSASTGFGLGTSLQAAKTTAASGFSFGSTTTTAAATGSLFGSGLTGLTTTTAGSALTATTTASQPVFKGLGGATSTATSSGQNDNGNKGTSVSLALKDQQVPEELCKDVQRFGDFVKKQKENSSEVGKFSVRSLHKIREEVTTLAYALGTVSSAVHRNKAAVQKLRSDFTEELRHVEMAQYTQDIPPSLQHDNYAPIKFFMDLIGDFEANTQTYRRQIEELDRYLSTYDQTSNLSPQDVYLALCKIQESFTLHAANFHTIHEQVKDLKERYLVYRRIVHGENIDIFAANRRSSAKQKPVKSSGLSPFNQLSNVTALAMASVVNQQTQQQPQQFAQPSLGAGSMFGSASKPTGTASLFGGSSLTAGTSGSKFGGFGGFGTATKPLSAGLSTSTSSSSLFGTASLNPSAGLTFGSAATGTPFELKRPPAGSKRGKK